MGIFDPSKIFSHSRPGLLNLLKCSFCSNKNATHHFFGIQKYVCDISNVLLIFLPTTIISNAVLATVAREKKQVVIFVIIWYNLYRISELNKKPRTPFQD